MFGFNVNIAIVTLLNKYAYLINTLLFFLDPDGVFISLQLKLVDDDKKCDISWL